MSHTTATSTALEAVQRGYTPIPLLTRSKRPGIQGWTRQRWDDPAEVQRQFDEWATEEKANIGILLGEPSGGLIDVDIDHHRAMRLRDYFLPPTPMKSGREGRPGSHYWYRAEEGTLPGTRQHLMPSEEAGKKGPVSVELRSTGAQTALPPSIHPTGESYTWSGDPWGGALGPAVVNGRVLAARVAMLGLASVLLDRWPKKGGRHGAYLALAGGLLSYGELSVHPFWGGRANAAEQLIRALAEATMDDDGPEARVHEAVDGTIASIRAGKRVTGFGTLAGIIGDDHVAQVRILMAEVESAAGFVSRQAPSEVPSSGTKTPPSTSTPPSTTVQITDDAPAEPAAEAANDDGDYESTWAAVEAEAYLTGKVESVRPSVLARADGKFLMYPGRVNMLYGSSESAKSWIALATCLQLIERGERVVYLDFEDEPVNTFSRLMMLGAQLDDIRRNFVYIHPEEPIAGMQRDRWGKVNASPTGTRNQAAFERVLADHDPQLIVADGMSVIYGLHGLNINDTVETDVITSWLKRLIRNGRTSVIVIDHTGKSAERGSLPIGSQHKVSMVQGTLLQAWTVRQPMPGEIGEIELIVLKDRPGEVRAISQRSGGAKAQVAALITMDSKTTPGQVAMTITPPMSPSTAAGGGPAAGNATVDLSRQRAAEKRERELKVEEYVRSLYNGELGKSLSYREIADLLPEGLLYRGGRNGQGDWKGEAKAAVERLVDQNWLGADGTTRDRRFTLLVGDAAFKDNPDLD